MLTGRKDLQFCQDNVRGYRQAISDAGVPYDERFVVSCDYSPRDGFRAIHQLMEHGIDFDGVFAANDPMAIGAIKALKMAGRRIPEDVAVIGFDNSFVGTLIEPSLSSVDVPLGELGYHAAEMLLKCILQEDRPGKCVLDCALVIRNSSDSGKRIEWDLENWFG